jgi:hypothetical protein
VQAADAGTTLTCQVTASNVVADVTVTAKNKLTVPVRPVNTGLPVVKAASGSTWTVGGQAQCTNGNWSGQPQTFSYQWLRDGNAIPGATTAVRTITAADGGHSLSCVVTATGRGGTGDPATSQGKSVQGAPTLVTAPSITGTPRPGRTLTCSRGTWQGATTFAYAWQRNGATIPGATTTKLTLGGGDVGATISCVVTASNTSGSTAANAPGVVVTP